MLNAVVIHTDEVNLKGANRHFFERLLLDNISAKLKDVVPDSVSQRKGTVILCFKQPLEPEIRQSIKDGLNKVFGIAHYAFAHKCAKDFETIKKMAALIMEHETGKTFKVITRRSDKSFDLDSMEMNRQIGGHLLSLFPGLKVDVHEPRIGLRIEINHDGAFISSEKITGPGGLPTGAGGQVLALLSGGIDSPVAAWKVLRRGCRADYVHFHSHPHTSRESIEKVRRLRDTLDQYQGSSRFYSVPFAAIQREIVAKTAPASRVVLYRRMMLRIATYLAGRCGARALVTGDSVGQVASQTVENISTVSSVTMLPVFRPLVGDDKRDIMALARKIGTYDISIEPHDDCCSLFVPEHPELFATEEIALREEAKLDHETLIKTAIEETEGLELKKAFQS